MEALVSVYFQRKALFWSSVYVGGGLALAAAKGWVGGKHFSTFFHLKPQEEASRVTILFFMPTGFSFTRFFRWFRFLSFPSIHPCQLACPDHDHSA